MLVLEQFLRDETGATAIEYGVIVGMLALAIVFGVGGVGNAVKEMFNGQDSAIREAFDH